MNQKQASGEGRSKAHQIKGMLIPTYKNPLYGGFYYVSSSLSVEGVHALLLPVQSDLADDGSALVIDMLACRLGSGFRVSLFDGIYNAPVLLHQIAVP